MIGAQQQNRNSAILQILLVANVLVAGNKKVKADILCRLDQFTILELAPRQLKGMGDIVGPQNLPQADWRVLIEENFQRAMYAVSCASA